VLAGGIAHDFNNLLTSILGNVSMARSLGSLEGRIAELFDKIEQAVKRSISLTHQLLTFSKGGEPIKKTVYLPDVIKESATLILSGSKVKPEYDIDNGLYQVYADQGQISQVFNNIIINAMQAMPAGGFLTIKARNVDDIQDIAPLPGGKYIAVSFSDQGIGIHRDNLNRIFDPYFTTKQGGTGLGLASSYSIIKKHNGYLDVSSTVGTGSTFSVYLPASDAGEIDREPESSERPGGTGRILVLDDEEIILDVAVSMLKYLGYTPDTAADGREAIRKYTGGLEQGEPYDAVIMDLTIPGGMGGREALVELLKIDPAVTAIVSSGYSEDPVMARYEKYGFTGILLKPYKLQDISAILDASLKKKKRGD
nr:ATP-binding protein [Spirochaetota bacterium]